MLVVGSLPLIGKGFHFLLDAFFLGRYNAPMLRFHSAMVRRLRRDRGWTLAQTGERAGGMSARAVQYVERGHVDPHCSTAARLAVAFGVPIEALFVEEPAARRRSSTKPTRTAA